MVGDHSAITVRAQCGYTGVKMCDYECEDVSTSVYASEPNASACWLCELYQHARLLHADIRTPTYAQFDERSILHTKYYTHSLLYTVL
jgi:hypothetical protein